MNEIVFYISVNFYSKGFITIEQNNKRIFESVFGFELPYDIAENISHALSFLGTVQLENEDYNITVYKNGEVIEEKEGEE